MEPRIPVWNSFIKPDLIAWYSHMVIVMDPIICGGKIRLSKHEAEKVAHHNCAEVWEYAKEVS